MQVLRQLPVAEDEKRELSKIVAASDDESYVPRLVGPDGNFIVLPHSVFQILKHIIFHVMKDREILLFPVFRELTTQEAAQILGVSRPYFIKLLEQKKIPFERVGSHRRVKLSDVLSYKQRRDEEQEKALDEIAQMCQDLGIYD